MKKLALVLALALSAGSLAACGNSEEPAASTPPSITPSQQQATDRPEASTPPPAPSVDPSETPDDGIEPAMITGDLSEEEVAAILERAANVIIDESDAENLQKINDDMEPLVEAFSDLNTSLNSVDMENAEWVATVTEQATTLEQICDTALQSDYGEKFADLEQLLDASFSAFKSSAASMKEGVANKDMNSFGDATNWLQVGMQYVMSSSTYMQTIMESSTGDQPASPDASASPATE